MANDDDSPIKEALEKLGALIEERVRRERLRDQLTGLANDHALTESLEGHVASGRDFWVAFIEIDKFKSVNDRFGYENADLLLKRVASTLADLAQAFGGDAQAFRAHGDEFFLAGASKDASPYREDVIAKQLDLARTKIAEVQVESSDERGTMCCTVSIGWLVAADLEGAGVRKIRDCLERAVDAAKRTRNATVRYSVELGRRATIALRADCGKCGTKFTLDVPVTDTATGALHCPNCHADVDRPPTAIEPIPPQAEPVKV